MRMHWFNQMRGLVLGLVSIATLLPTPCVAMTEVPEDSAPVQPGAPAAAASKPDHDDDSSVLLLPVVAYGEETSWQFGAAGIYLFPQVRQEVPRSNVSLSLQISVRGQFIAAATSNAFLLDDALRLNTVVNGFVWPTRYYSRDPESDSYETYSYSGGKGETLAGFRLAGKLYAGPSLAYLRQSNDVPEEGLMQSERVVSENGHHAIGPGLAVVLDSRDIGYAASRGVYIGAKAHQLLGLDATTANYQDFRVFGRGYLSSESTRDTLALAAEVHGVNGAVPFGELPTSDGTTVLRGIRRARYIANALATAQVEYRRVLGDLGPTGPWGMTIFAEVGQFFEKVSTFTHRVPVFSVGAGLRYLFIPKDRVSVRLDVAYVDGGVGVVINALEAF